MEDGLDLIREAAAEALGVLMKVAGDKAVSPFLEKLDKLKETKVREHFERLASSQSKSSTVVGNPQKSSISVPKLTSKKFPSVTKAPSKNIPPKKKTTKPPSTGEAKTTEVKSNEPQTIYFRFTDDSARQYFEEKLPEVVKEMSDSNWKVRLAAVQSLSDFLINNNSEDLSAEATVRFFSLLPGWKESNFQVMIKLIDALEWLATNCSSFDRAAASLAIPGIDLC